MSPTAAFRFGLLPQRLFCRGIASIALLACVLAIPGLAAAAVEATSAANAIVSPLPERCMHIGVHQQDDRLTLQAEFGGAMQTVIPERSAGILSKEFRRIYDMLEENRRLDARFDARMAILSHELFGPLLPGLRKAPCVIFEIEPTSMHFALDLLPVDGVPLFVQKPVAFSLEKGGVAAAQETATQVQAPATQVQVPARNAPTAALGPQSKGFIVRDPETDPDDATSDVQKLYPGSTFQLIKSATPDMFSRSRYDFLLISGEGVVSPTWGKPEKDENDAIGLGEDDMYARDLQGAAFSLVYLDASQLAMSKAFIDAARRSGARHYLAPIITNEIGHSSTLTLRYFFGDLNQGMAPIDALYRTRRQLYKEFEGRVNRTEQIYYAYPFRLYLL